MKRCGTCELEKPLESFSKDSRSLRRGGDGRQSRCKVCKLEYSIENASKIREYNRGYGAENRVKIGKTNREYRAANVDRVRDYHHRYYITNITKRREYNREYRAEHYDKLRERSREYRLANLDKFQANHAKRRALKLALPNETVRLTDILSRDFDPSIGFHTCWMCGTETAPEWDSKHIDHLVPLSANRAALEAFGIENPGTVLANLALACPPCNLRKKNHVMLCAVLRYMINVSEEESRAA